MAVVGRRSCGGEGEEAREVGGAGVGLKSLAPSGWSSRLGFSSVIPCTHFIMAWNAMCGFL